MHLAIFAPLLASWALLALLFAVAVLAALTLPSTRSPLRSYAAREHRSVLALGWLFSLVATLGSLYFSEIVGFVPCLLCWYQRIAMYPLVIVLGVAALLGDRGAWRYALPITAVGAVIAIYHVVIQYRPDLDVVTCSVDVPCTARYLNVFGFVTIPFMAGSGFLAISALMLAVRGGPESSGLTDVVERAEIRI